MINEKNLQLGKVRSSIRELYEYGKKLKAEIGEENVYDFSLGNPSVPAPKEIEEELKNLINGVNPVLLHGYTSAQGDFSARKAVACNINNRFNTALTPECIYLTCGAAASLTITLNALLNPGDEVITFSPYFPEYKVFTQAAGGKLIAVKTRTDNFQIDFNELNAALSPKTKAVIINSPNNPTGVVYGEENVKKLCNVLKRFSSKNSTEIYLISDEPYRELVYDKSIIVPYVMNYYDKSIVCYSYSKSLSLPGERIGYIAVNNAFDGWQKVYAAVCGAGRALGYVCAPALFQRLIEKTVDKTADFSVYKNNRDLLLNALTEYGYQAVKPDGAFYLFIKSFEADSDAFAERAKKFNLLIVSSKSFGVEGYARISYCVDSEMIKRSLPAFKALAASYKNNN